MTTLRGGWPPDATEDMLPTLQIAAMPSLTLAVSLALHWGAGRKTLSGSRFWRVIAFATAERRALNTFYGDAGRPIVGLLLSSEGRGEPNSSMHFNADIVQPGCYWQLARNGP
ncbi:MAG: hypothetical protein CM15mP84_05010 [Cellvibrionales bacterium]|nr:MAG: hypothetical protein CM15mP84_05010 [Cellvibrionales bacterium]